MVSLNINIGRKEAIFFSVVILLFVVAGFGIASYSNSIPSPGHGGDSVLVNYGGIEMSLQSAINAGALSGESAQAVNIASVDLAVQDTWYEVVKIKDFSCDDKDISINSCVSTISGSSANGLFDMRLLIGATEKVRVQSYNPYASKNTLCLTWVEKLCSGTNDLIIQVRAVHSASVGANVNSVDFPGVINVVKV